MAGKRRILYHSPREINVLPLRPCHMMVVRFYGGQCARNRDENDVTVTSRVGLECYGIGAR